VECPAFGGTRAEPEGLHSVGLKLGADVFIVSKKVPPAEGGGAPLKALPLEAAFSAAEGLAGREKLFERFCFLWILGGYFYHHTVFGLLSFALEMLGKVFRVATAHKHFYHLLS
jgi:hypothetical protein